MACEHIEISPGVGMIVCGPRRKRVPPCGCGAPGERECDFPLAGRRRGAVCNRSLCVKCTTVWALTAPVQPAPSYRKRHGDLDLCRPHAAFVARGCGPALFALLAQLRGGRGDLHARLDHAPLVELPSILEEAAAAAAAYLARHPDAPARPGRMRVERLGLAMRDLATSLRACGDPVAVYEAEKLALVRLRAGVQGGETL